MRRICCLLLLAALWTAAALADAPGRSALPAALKFTQRTVTSYGENRQVTTLTYPATARPEVDREIAALVDGMALRAAPLMPARAAGSLQTRLDVGANVFRCGTRWMSFLTVARIAYNLDQIYVDFDARVYNMEDGSRVTLAQVIGESEEAWRYLGREAARQLMAYFPDTAADLDALTGLVTRQALEQTPFTLTPGHLSLHYRADALYGNRPGQLMHVDIYYPDLKPWMSAEGLRETDCSRYAMVAVTYDDGPARGSSEAVMNALRLYGAEATFFVVGDRLPKGADLVKRAHDAGHDVQSHNYTHATRGLKKEKILSWKAQMDAALSGCIGRVPTMMRTPGGMDSFYIDAGVGLPLIRWNRVSGDAEDNEEHRNDPGYFGWRVAYARDGDIVLCHDLNRHAGVAAEIYLPYLEDRDILLVSVADLCAARGVPLLPDVTVFSCP